MTDEQPNGHVNISSSPLNEGYLRKGGQNPAPQNFVRPPPPPAFRTDLNTEQLNGKYKQAYEFAMNDHLQAKQDLDAAKQEIEELRFKLTEQQVKIDAMDAFNKLLEDRLNMAMVDRTRAIDERAEYAVKLDMLRKLLEKPLENMA